MNKFKYFIIIGLVYLFNTVFAQSRYTGTVVDDITKVGIKGATIKNLRSEVLAISGADGNFQIISDIQDSIWISSVGYMAKKVAINKTNLQVTLIPHPVLMDEVEISTGYYSLPKERATGSFDFIDNTLIQRSTSSSILDRLEDITPSLQFDKRRVGQISGDNERVAMRLRGANTIYADGSPLVVLDNFPYDGDIMV